MAYRIEIRCVAGSEDQDAVVSLALRLYSERPQAAEEFVLLVFGAEESLWEFLRRPNDHIGGAHCWRFPQEWKAQQLQKMIVLASTGSSVNQWIVRCYDDGVTLQLAAE